MRYRLLKGYIGTWTCYGFYRGWIADYVYDRYTQEIRSPSYSLVTEKYTTKGSRGCVNAVLYATLGHIFAVHNFICRIEILLTNKDPYDHKDVYCEFLGYSITLPPSHDK